jgi:predicted PurR-regulated permease PerM
MVSDQEFTRRLVRTVLTVAAVVIVLAALWAARDALMLIYVSGLIAMGFSPVVRLIERPTAFTNRRGVPRVLAILAVYLAIIAVIVLIGMLIIPSLIEQATTLWERLPQHFNDFQRILIKYKLTTHRITFQEAVQNAPSGTSGNAVTTVLGAVWSIAGGIFGIVTIVILSFYFLIEAEGLMHYVTKFVPMRQRAQVRAAAAESVSKVSAWLRAQLTLAGIMGGAAAIGLGLLHEPYFYVVALVAAVGETIPIVGPIIAGVTAVIIAITVSTRLAVTVGIFFIILHQLEANILVPKVMERRVGVSPVTVMVALLIGGELWGLIGAILAIPTAAILSVVIDEFSNQQEVGRAV